MSTECIRVSDSFCCVTFNFTVHGDGMTVVSGKILRR
jgi:hypothetical protein